MFNWLERPLIFPAPPRHRGNWDMQWFDKEDVYFESPRGPGRRAAQLHGWFAPHPKAKQVILYAHGQTEHVASLASVVARLQDALDASVLVFDYRGYGKSEGRATEGGAIADAMAAQQWLAERTGKLPEELILIGRSLGGAVAVGVAAERGAKALILENTFGRLVDVASYHYPWLPVRPFMRNRFDSIRRIARYEGPLLQLHGTRDRIAPAKFARELYAACPSPMKRFYTVRRGVHHDATPLAFYSHMAKFLDEVEAFRKIGTLPAVFSQEGSAELSSVG
ncbi:alpha/beta hydrolase [Botrimarina hoheduenensis]|uniref:Alpha/beta hydrolase family protein n=1 Tax=Botrimarina hoheduenensis TaxID=2528000 RepID=A0A5C5WBT7_9BACT|nr:alpha/beta hydrolase [Botrimarina hoheduenensis]TWT48376.1 Alpha/beta hydrolase family protein [Botrimarina hoheduenensis]